MLKSSLSVFAVICFAKTLANGLQAGKLVAVAKLVLLGEVIKCLSILLLSVGQIAQGLVDEFWVGNRLNLQHQI